MGGGVLPHQHFQGDKSILYTVAGPDVCESAFRLAYGIRYNRFNCVNNKFSSGVHLVEHGLVVYITT